MPSPTQPKVMLVLPSGRTWEARTSTSVNGLIAFSLMNGIQLGIVNMEGSMITKQRCDLADQAAAQKPDFLLWIDTDMMFPPNALLRLLQHNKDIVGATYNKRVPPYETLGKLKGAKPSEVELAQGGLREAELLPMGFMLVRTEVFQKIRFPYFYECYQWPGDTGVEAFKEQLRGTYHSTPPDSVLDSIAGTTLGNWLDEIYKIENVSEWKFFSEDLAFCRKCLKHGYQIWCDLSLTFEIKHLGVLEVTCIPQQPAANDTMVVNAVM